MLMLKWIRRKTNNVDQLKSKIGMYVAENGNANTVTKFIRPNKLNCHHFFMRDGGHYSLFFINFWLLMHCQTYDDCSCLCYAITSMVSKLSLASTSTGITDQGTKQLDCHSKYQLSFSHVSWRAGLFC